MALVMMSMVVCSTHAREDKNDAKSGEVLPFPSPESQLEMFKDAERLRILDWIQVEVISSEEELKLSDLTICKDGTAFIFIKNDEIVAMYPVKYLSMVEAFIFYEEIQMVLLIL